MTARQCLSLILILLASAALSAQNKDSLQANTILFKVTHPESQTSSFLFGTHHAFGPEFFDSLSAANRALSSCEIVILESVDVPGHLPEDIINGRTAETDWSGFLNKNDLGFITDLFYSSPTDFNRMTPTEMYVFLSRYFNQRICLMRDMDDMHVTLDNHIGSKGESLGLRIIGLETAEEQIEFINKDVAGMPSKVHKRRLAGIIDKIRDHRREDCGETDWYRRMDIDYRLDEPCGNTLMLTDRNNRWMETISDNVKESSCFIVVGLSHLMYECGLTKQLEQLGYRVKPINPH